MLRTWYLRVSTRIVLSKTSPTIVIALQGRPFVATKKCDAAKYQP